MDTEAEIQAIIEQPGVLPNHHRGHETMKKIILTLFASLLLITTTLAQGTLERQIPTTSQLSRWLLTNETAAGWAAVLNIALLQNTNGVSTNDVRVLSLLNPLSFFLGNFAGTANGLSNVTAHAADATLTATFTAQAAAVVPPLVSSILSGSNFYTGYFTGTLGAVTFSNPINGASLGTGTVTSNQLAASTITSNQVAPFAINVANMDDGADFVRMSALNLVSGHIGRFCWTNTHAKAQAQKTIRLMELGTGWVFDGSLGDIFFDLTNYFPYAGSYGFTAYINNWASLNGWVFNFNAGGYLTNFDGNAADTNWFNTFAVLTNNTASMNIFPSPSGTLPVQDNFEVDYLMCPDGGTFKIQTNINGGAFADLSGFTSIAGSNNVPTGNTAKWSIPTPAVINIKVVNTTQGTNRIVGAGSYNSTITNGLIFMTCGLQSSGLYQASRVPTNNSVPIFTSWAPDLILLKGDDSGGANGNVAQADPPAMTNLDNMFRLAKPAADMVVCGAWDYGTNINTIYGIPAARTNQMILSWQRGRGYFNAHDLFPTYPEMVSRGYYLTNGGHLTAQGYSTYSALLWQWMSIAGRY